MVNLELVAVISESAQLANNRWHLTSDLIPNQAVLSWGGIYKLTTARLERLKICGHADRVLELLASLSGRCPVKQLEIDAIELRSVSKTECSFEALEKLSIDQVRLVGQVEEERAHNWTSLRFEAPRLNVVFLGKHHSLLPAFLSCFPFASLLLSVHPHASDQLILFSVSSLCLADAFEPGPGSGWHIQLSHPDSVKHLSIEEADLERLRSVRYGELETFEFTMIAARNKNEQVDLDLNLLISWLACASKQRLRRFYFNLARIDSTSYRPNAAQMPFLRRLYDSLKTELGITPDVEVFINYGKVDFPRSFYDQHFGRDLIQQHQQSTVAPCPSVSKVDYNRLAQTIFRDLNEPAILPGVLRKFADTFANVQVVHLVRLPPTAPFPSVSIVADVFLSFLHSCRAIRELKLGDSGLDQSFYDELVLLPSLQSLTKFVHLELPEFVPLSYAFLSSLPNLLCFFTTSATLATMLFAVQEMRVDAEYTFRFRRSNWYPKHYYDCRIQRKNQRAYDLKIELTNFAKRAVHETLTRQSCATLEAIPRYFEMFEDLRTFSKAADSSATGSPQSTVV